MRQRLKRLLLMTAALAALLAAVGKLALASAYASRQALARLTDAVGAPVRVGEVQLGFLATALRNLEVLENTPSSGPPPWSSAAAVEAELSLWQLLRSDLAAGAVTLRDVPDWGPWTVAGGRVSAADPFRLVLKTAKEVHATPALLRRAPFVSPVTWREVELDGHTDCEVDLRFPPDGPVRYRVELHPHDTRVTVRAIDLTAYPARGRVLVEDGVVTLEDVRGTAAGGDVAVGSVMDFRSPVASVLRFTVDAGRVGLKRLPESWRAPRMDGEVAGRADLELTIRGGRATTRGRGEGTVRPALPFVPPIRVTLDADGRGFRFGLGRGS
jgi:hypothetical protein